VGVVRHAGADVEIKLDPDTSELLTRTPAAMTGYLDDPVATNAAFDATGSGPATSRRSSKARR